MYTYRAAHALHKTVCIRESVGGGVSNGVGSEDGNTVGDIDGIVVGKLLGTAVGTLSTKNEFSLVSESPLGAVVGAVEGPQLIAPPQSIEHAERTPFVQVSSAVLFPTMHSTVHEAEDAIFVDGTQLLYLFSAHMRAS